MREGVRRSMTTVVTRTTGRLEEVAVAPQAGHSARAPKFLRDGNHTLGSDNRSLASLLREVRLESLGVFNHCSKRVAPQGGVGGARRIFPAHAGIGAGIF